MYLNYGIIDKKTGLFLCRIGKKLGYTENEDEGLHCYYFDEAYYLSTQVPEDCRVYLLPHHKYQCEELPYRIAADQKDRVLMVYNQRTGENKACISFDIAIKLFEACGYLV